jgi:hypothetical protein
MGGGLQGPLKKSDVQKLFFQFLCCFFKTESPLGLKDFFDFITQQIALNEILVIAVAIALFFFGRKISTDSGVAGTGHGVLQLFCST